MMKNWVVREPEHEDLLRDLLAARGIREEAQVEKFLFPDYERDLSDPLLMTDMEQAVRRIQAAVQAGERITIFGDYDADGVPGSVVVAEFFRQIGYENFDIYLPDRHLEQYGLSLAAVEKIAGWGTKLIITVDCGIANWAEVERARELGVEVIVTDHHLPLEKLPRAVAVVNPKRPDDAYPDKMLCGAGVAFKLVQALTGSGYFNLPFGWERWLLDLVGIATVSDMVPLRAENRVLAYYGLKVLRKTRRVGLQALYRALRLRPEHLSEDDIGFVIGPRINTASRMSHASHAYDLLTTNDEAQARALAQELEALNAERRLSVDAILSHLAETVPVEEVPPLIVAGRDDWSLGVLGLTASRVLDKYQRVVFLWGKNSHGEVKGSCRSDGSVNVVELMRLADREGYFSNFGGHVQAGGFSLPAARVGELPERLLAAYAAMSKAEIKQEIVADRELELEQVAEPVYRQVEKLAPFGLENPKPVFLFRNLTVAEVKHFGADGIHLELGFKDSAGRLVKAVAFFNIFAGLGLAPGRRVDLLASLEKSYFRFRPELRLRIVDLRPAA